MTLTARVQNGRLVLDEPADLPEGELVQLEIVGGVEREGLSDEDRADLQARLAKARADVAAGRTVDAREFLRQLAERRL
jgi:hypothetical protein